MSGHLTSQKGEWKEDFSNELEGRLHWHLNGLIFFASFWQHFRLRKQLAVRSVEVIVPVSLAAPRGSLRIALHYGRGMPSSYRQII